MLTRARAWLRRQGYAYFREEPRTAEALTGFARLRLALPSRQIRYSTPVASGLIPLARLVASGEVQTMTPVWRMLDRFAPHAVESAKDWFLMGEYRSGHFASPVRVAAIDNESLILDPVAVTDVPDAWRAVSAALPEPDFHAHRMAQACANRPMVGFDLPRGLHAGRPAYVVGNGPSAAQVAVLPPREQRDGIVFALNGAAHLLPGNHDYWCVCDSLWPRGDDAWLAALLADWATMDHSGAQMLAAVYTHQGLTRGFFDTWGPVHFYHGAHRNPYRDLFAPDRPRLPSFIESWQSITTVMHLAYYLGCSPIFLVGVDQGRPLGSTRFHAGGAIGWRPSGMPTAQEWYAHPGVRGTVVETTAYLALCGQHVAAMAMWLMDAGVPAFNCGAGLDYYFAPVAPFAEIVAEYEGVAA